jgi:hypothetical protein
MIDTAKMRYACENWRRPGPGYGAGEIFANLPEMLDELDAARKVVEAGQEYRNAEQAYLHGFRTTGAGIERATNYSRTGQILDDALAAYDAAVKKMEVK